MPRAIWSGAISFGLVNIPVKMYSAVKRQNVRFHQLDGRDNVRIQQKRVNPDTGEEVPYDKLVKGYEISPDRYVVIEPAELDSLQPEKTRSIDIEDFVDMEEIDPVYYDHPYYLAPGTGAGKAYGLLVSAMSQSDKVGIARVVIRSKEQLVAIRSRDGVLTMETMLFGDEVVPPEDLGEMPDPKKTKPSKKEVEMAEQLIESLSSDFDPDKYRDTYREAVLEMIEKKADGQEIEIAEPSESEPDEVPDLMAALEASINSSKRQSSGGSSSKSKSSSSNGSKAKSSSNGSKSKASSSSGSKSTAKKKPAAKKKTTAKS